MSRKLDWTLLLIQPFDCRPLLLISAYSGHFAPDFAPGFAPEIDPKAFGVFAQRSQSTQRPKKGSLQALCYNRTGFIAMNNHRLQKLEGRRHVGQD
jgi:hypothetical protein